MMIVGVTEGWEAVEQSIGSVMKPSHAGCVRSQEGADACCSRNVQSRLCFKRRERTPHSQSRRPLLHVRAMLWVIAQAVLFAAKRIWPLACRYSLLRELSLQATRIFASSNAFETGAAEVPEVPRICRRLRAAW